MDKVRIVIIDSGIDINEKYLKGYIKKDIGYRFDSNYKIINELNPMVRNMHGTLIAKTIKYICNDVEFISINILDENLRGDSTKLMKALDEALIFNPHIVHLSLGLTKFKYFFLLKKYIKRLNDNNVIVVSAANNEGRRSYPAYYKDVVGVKGLDISDDSFYHCGRFFCASLFLPQFIIDENEMYKTIQGNSISAAYITGHISNIIMKSNLINNNDIVQCLRNKGKENYIASNIRFSK